MKKMIIHKNQKRIVVCMFMFLFLASSVYAHRDRIERPSYITVEYNTGEKIQLKYIGFKLQEIKIIMNGNEVIVPHDIINKIDSIKIETLCLLWSDSNKKAEDSDYFFIRFNSGNKLYFGEYKEVSIFFENLEYKRAEQTIKINRNTWQNREL